MLTSPARHGSRATWMKKTLAMRRPGHAQPRPRSRATWVARTWVKKTQATRHPGRALPRFLCSAFFWFFFFFFFFSGFSLICYGFCIYKGCKSSFRDSIFMWSPRGKICHIGPHQTIEIEFQRLEMLINNIVSELAY